MTARTFFPAPRIPEPIDDGVLILNPVSRQITDANSFIADLLGYAREELLGKELWQIGLLKDESASHSAFRELQQKGEICYENLLLQTKSGAKRELKLSPIVTRRMGSRSSNATSATSPNGNALAKNCVKAKHASAPCSIWSRLGFIPVMPQEPSRNSTAALWSYGDGLQSPELPMSHFAALLDCIGSAAHSCTMQNALWPRS